VEVFFDNRTSAAQTFTSKFTPKLAASPAAATAPPFAIDDLLIGPSPAPLKSRSSPARGSCRIDAAIKTEKDRLAVFYDTGLVASSRHGNRSRDRYRGRSAKAKLAHCRKAHQSRPRRLSIEYKGAVACFPPPHQFQFPRDYSTNLVLVWAGEGIRVKIRPASASAKTKMAAATT